MTDHHAKARELCAKLVPHMTSSHNVSLIAEALREAANTFPSLPDGWFIMELVAEKIRNPVDSYECTIQHTGRMLDLEGKQHTVFGVGSNPIEAISSAISKIKEPQS